MLDDLVTVIETLKERIQSKHRSELAANETRTRMALIDSLLTALGWDTSDPAHVVPEYSVGTRKADYGLRNAGPTPAAFIEAKKLGERLEPYREQMTNYSNMAGVKYAGLTNGDQWELYEVFKQASLDERRILNISILNDPSHESALKLLLLWRPNLESGSPIPANEPGLGGEIPERGKQLTNEELAPGVKARPPIASDEDVPIRWVHNGKEHHAVLRPDGGVLCEDGIVRTPSGACDVLGNLPQKHARNGWRSWKYRDESGEWLVIDTLPRAAEMKNYNQQKARKASSTAV